MARRGSGDGTKLTDGRWRTTVTIESPSGKSKKTVTGRTQAEMRAKAARVRADADRIAAGDLVLAELKDRWDATFAHSRAAKTKDSYLTSWNALAPLHNARIHDLRRPVLSDFLNDVYQTKSRSAEQMKSLLAVMLDYAVDRGYIDSNPARGIVWHHRRARTTYRKLTRAEVTRITEHPSPLRPFWLFLSETGLRPWREAIELDTTDLVKTSDSWWVIVTESKTDAGVRVAPVKTSTAKLLAKSGSGPLFTWHGSRLTKGVAHSEWRKLLTELEIPHTRVYELRHYANVQIELSDAPELVKQWFLGHESRALNLTTYGKASPETMVEVLSQMPKRKK